MNDPIYCTIKEYRTNNNLTLKELSDKTGLSVSLLSKLERGLSPVTDKVRIRLFLTLNISVKSVGLSSYINSLQKANESLMDSLHEYQERIRALERELEDCKDIFKKMAKYLPKGGEK